MDLSGAAAHQVEGAKLKSSHGFTLVELVTTMVVIGIIGVFVAGRLDFTNAFEQRGVRDKVKAALQFARKAAVVQRRSVCVCVGTLAGGVCTAGNRVTLSTDIRNPETTGATFCDGSGGGASMAPLALPAADRQCGGATNAVCSATNATIASATPTFVFDAQGRASATAVVTVTGQPDVGVAGSTGYVN